MLLEWVSDSGGWRGVVVGKSALWVTECRHGWYFGPVTGFYPDAEAAKLAAEKWAATHIPEYAEALLRESWRCIGELVESHGALVDGIGPCNHDVNVCRCGEDAIQRSGEDMRVKLAALLGGAT